MRDSAARRDERDKIFSSCLDVMQRVSLEISDQVHSGGMRDESADSGGFLRTKTNLDTLSNCLFAQYLTALFPGIPILSEENLSAEYTLEGGGKESLAYFVIDPIDGTNHLMHGDSQWLINLALCVGGEAVMGICALPAQGLIYAALQGESAFVLEQESKQRRTLCRRPMSIDSGSKLVFGLPSPLDLGGNESYLDLWKEFADLNEAETKQFGTSYSLLLVAEGELDVFANFSGNFHWDTAAQQVILECSGCRLVEIDWNKREQIVSELDPLRYPLEGMLKDEGHIAAASSLPPLILPEELRVATPKAANWWS